MDNLKLKFEKLSDDDLIEVLTLKRSEYTNDAIIIAKEEFYKRNLIVPEDILSEINCEEKDKEWYYAISGERCGPISKFELVNLYKNETIFLNTKVWKKGMPDWSELWQTDVIAMENTPPPLKSKDIDNTFVWILAFVPVIGITLEYLLFIAADTTNLSFWFVYAILNTILGITDERKLKKAGYNTKELMLWAIFLVPVYLFRRAYLLKQKNGYAIVWCITFAITFFI